MLNRQFLSKIERFISYHNLLDKEERYLVALSGGADSVALTLALIQLGYAIEAAHCNFHLRGEESDRDEDFCRQLCDKHDVRLHVAHFDTLEFARLRKISVEMAARDLRYSYFKQLIRDIGASSVCVAHHRDDSAETVLLNLIRGTGIRGLAGISPRNGYVARPMLGVSREEIEAALRLAGQEYVTDSTNLENEAVRNQIRLDILPLMRKINPSVGESIARTAERVRQATEALDMVTRAATDKVVTAGERGGVVLSLDALMSSPAPEQTLFEVLTDYDFTPATIDQVFRTARSGPGKTFSSPTHELLIDRGQIIIEPADEGRRRALRIPEEGLYVYDDNVKFKVETLDASSSVTIDKSPDKLYADLAKVSFPLTVRRVEAGDRFVPFGMRGSRLISDYLTDKKMNLFDKRRQLVVTDNDGRIIWLAGQRADNRCRIGTETKTVLVITRVVTD